MLDSMFQNLNKVFFVAGLLLFTACGNTVPNSIQPSITNTPVAVEGKIALLLPYGNEINREHLELATNLENAARMALADQPSEGIDLQVYPTQGTIEGAVAAAQNAINDGAIIILGPVFKDASVRVAEIASPYNVPVFSFSNDPSIIGGNLFVLGYTFENAANRLIKFANLNGREQILTVYAQNLEGQVGKSAIDNALKLNGIGLNESVSYEFSQRGVVDSIPKIMEFVQQSETDMIIFTATTSGALSYLGQLLPEAGIDTNEVKFAGLTRWDIPQSNLRNEGLQGGWFTLPDPNLSVSFSSQYQYNYGVPPHIIASLGYDGIIVSKGIINSLGNAQISELRKPRGFVGALGPFRFGEGGHIERSIAVAEVQNGRPLVISPAPRILIDTFL